MKSKVNQDLLNKSNALLGEDFIDIVHAFETSNGLMFGFNRNGFYSHVSLTNEELILRPNFNLTHPDLQDLLFKYGLTKKEA
tara:strand:+ start:131 stop:376 length:246 start_codon:yes stop_codon:yes gene_type:complete